MYQFVKGLKDHRCQERILEASANEEGGELSLEKVVKLAESFEMGKTSQEIVNKGQVSCISEYQRGKSKSRQDSKAKSTNSAKPASDKCGNCGKQGHSSKLNDRRANCAAFDKTCSKCKTNGHFAEFCRGGPRESRDKSKSRPTSKVNEVKAADSESKDNQNEEGKVGMLSGSWFLLNGLQDPSPKGSLYEVSDVFTSGLHSGSPDPWGTPSLAALSTKQPRRIRHHALNEFGKWQPSNVAPHGRVHLQVKPSQSAQQQLQLPSLPNSSVTTVEALADSGAQMCIADWSVASRLGLTKDELLLPALTVSIADNSNLEFKLGRVHRTACLLCDQCWRFLFIKRCYDRIGYHPQGLSKNWFLL